MLTADQTTELAEMFRLLGEPNRLRIVASCLDRTLSVGEITARLAQSQSLVSHHLRLLRAARLLKAVRRGKQVYYSIADGHVREMLTNMIEHIAEPDEHDDSINIETGVTS
ncbi:MAG: ArsR family transcriptional regulator, lead/cadmium/zinc/bismuth-responsive transcriptional [Acetobacteraceae bacterium]|nr:ArsR family transcriptional regulator, lead/cadmium/zinc/bismuth-responsive transcriptional [Acetobacteraceae bacterium]